MNLALAIQHTSREGIIFIGGILCLIGSIILWALLIAWRTYRWLKIHPEETAEAKGELTSVTQYGLTKCFVNYRFTDATGNALSGLQTVRSFSGKSGDEVGVVYNLNHTRMNFLKGYENEYWMGSVAIIPFLIMAPIFFFLGFTFKPLVAFLILVPISIVLSALFQRLFRPK